VGPPGDVVGSLLHSRIIMRASVKANFYPFASCSTSVIFLHLFLHGLPIFYSMHPSFGCAPLKPAVRLFSRKFSLGSMKFTGCPFRSNSARECDRECDQEKRNKNGHMTALRTSSAQEIRNAPDFPSEATMQYNCNGNSVSCILA